MKIGNVKLDSKAILAPMAAINCASFRLMCREMGAGLVSTPMIVINQLVANSDTIIERTCFLKNEKPLSVQLVGSDPKIAKTAVGLIEEHADIIDINMGCPEKDILALKAGSFFVKHPEQMKKIVEPIISNTNKPVTAKIRIGWDDKSINTIETVKILEDLGVSAITIHGRTKTQKYSGKANWDEIKLAKDNCNIPIIGNGDVFKPGTAKSMIETTGCDFVMIGRGAIGNPHIFTRVHSLLEQGKHIDELNDDSKLKMFLQFLKYYDKYEKNRKFSELRQQATWFTKGITGAKDLRRNLLQAATVEDIINIYS